MRMKPALLLVAAAVSLAAVLLPPLESAARELFAAHMAQHLILICIAAPLLGLARPWPALARVAR